MRGSGRPNDSGSRNFSGDREFSDGDSGRPRNRFKDNRRDMHDVTCAKCGKECQVPFKPTSGRPVYCKECFVYDEKPKDNPSRPAVSSDQFAAINKKLDKIMAALKID
ncbi:hypothetical protein HY642_04145 [Candidatus Woesearchaeota archaeon]|nr:hypothetical protein [Candidatus Woesearchaeota archaeon]